MGKRGCSHLRSLITGNNVSRKRSQSEVISIVLIILLVIVAVLIVYVVVRNMIKKGTDDSDTASLNIILTTAKISIRSNANSVVIPVSRKPGDGNISEIRIMFKDSRGATVCTYSNKTDVPGELEAVSYNVSLTGECVNAVSYEVYPIIISGGKEVIGMKAIEVSYDSIRSGSIGGCPGCGPNAYTGNVFCNSSDKNLYRNYISYVCSDSRCLNATSSKLIQTCGNEGCDAGVCVGIPLPSCTDTDGDGYNLTVGGVCGSLADCNDTNANVWTNVQGYRDQDLDGEGISPQLTVCSNGNLPLGYISNLVSIIDCNDTNSKINHTATEVCDGMDNNCDNVIDEAWGNCVLGQICSGGACVNDIPIDILPAMTSDTLPTGYIANATNSAALGPPYYAFDNNPATAWWAYSKYWGDADYRDLVIEIPSAIILKGYGIRGVDSGNTYSPKSWQLIGYGGTTAFLLDSRTSISWQAISGGELKRFDISNPAAYDKYALRILEMYASADKYNSVREMELYIS